MEATMKNFNAVPFGDIFNKVSSIGAHMVPFGELKGVNEVVFDLPVKVKSGKSFPFTVRIYSSVEHGSYNIRDCGEDAIRVCLVDKNGKVLKSAKRINRIGETDEILDRVVDRCRDMFKVAIDPNHHCPNCDGLMVERTVKKTGSKFLGCSNYPNCNHTAKV